MQVLLLAAVDGWRWTCVNAGTDSPTVAVMQHVRLPIAIDLRPSFPHAKRALLSVDEVVDFVRGLAVKVLNIPKQYF